MLTFPMISLSDSKETVISQLLQDKSRESWYIFFFSQFAGFEGSPSFTVSACARILQILNTVICSQHGTQHIMCLHLVFYLSFRIQVPLCFPMIEELQ